MKAACKTNVALPSHSLIKSICYPEAYTVTTERQSCLNESDGSLHLDPSHAYYYQVQTQMFMCKVNYCVCTFPKETLGPSMHIERITADSTFWDKCVDASSHFFQLVFYLNS